MDAGISAAPEMSFQVHTGLQPLWAWYTLYVLLVTCMVLVVWYSSEKGV